MKNISMKPVLFTLLAASTLALSGCSKQAAETVPAPATTEAPSSADQTQTQPPATSEEPASSKAAESLPPESATSESSTASSQTQSIPEPILLDPDTDYYYDLDSDGTEEQISYTIRSVDEWNQAPALFINGQEQIYSSNSEIYGYSGGLYLMDLDTSDGLLDLHLEWFSDSNTLSLFNFLQYKGGTLINLGDLAGTAILRNLGDIFRLDSSFSAPGNGTVLIHADTPIYTSSIGCYFCTITFQLQNDKLTEVPQDEYDIHVFDPQQTYKAKRDFTATLSPGAEEAAYSVATDQTVTIHKIALIGDALYAQVTNESGQTGWILCNEEYFYETPAWG